MILRLFVSVIKYNVLIVFRRPGMILLILGIVFRLPRKIPQILGIVSRKPGMILDCLFGLFAPGAKIFRGASRRKLRLFALVDTASRSPSPSLISSLASGYPPSLSLSPARPFPVSPSRRQERKHYLYRSARRRKGRFAPSVQLPLLTARTR